MPKKKRGRPPKYNAMEICERSIKIIKTLGVADCTKTAVAVAFYDPKFNPNEPGEKERLLSIGDKQGESAIARQRRRAKRISQRVSYLELLETNHCPEFEQLVAAVDGGMSEMGLGMWLVSWIGTTCGALASVVVAGAGDCRRCFTDTHRQHCHNQA